jgi:hypothetical protein
LPVWLTLTFLHDGEIRREKGPGNDTGKLKTPLNGNFFFQRMRVRIGVFKSLATDSHIVVEDASNAPGFLSVRKIEIVITPGLKTRIPLGAQLIAAPL